MSVFPGLCGEMAAVPYKVFLGTLPNLAIEERFLRQVQPVFAWYASRKRVKEQANEFIEIDLASCDPELLLRYTHVYYSRRQIYEDLLDKQFTLMETGKAAKPADANLTACLSECNAAMAARLGYELRLLEATKRSCNVPNRRELKPDSALEASDYLCMMRIVEEDVCGVEDAESKARAFLPRELMEAKADELARALLGAAQVKPLSKKDQKQLQRLMPVSYTKVGAIEKMRPVDVTSLFRFSGERVNAVPSDGTSTNSFRRALWGHAFRKFATHPGYLRAVSSYWAKYAQVDPESPLTTMPADLAQAVCLQQNLFPALKFRSQFLYTSPEVARQQWRSDHVVPLMRLFPLLGASAAEDLAASMVVEGEWAKLALAPEANPLEDKVLRAVQQAMDQVGGLYETNLDAVLKRVEDGAKAYAPVLSEKENLSVSEAEANARSAVEEST